jgi:hypothetical protein
VLEEVVEQVSWLGAVGLAHAAIATEAIARTM